MGQERTTRETTYLTFYLDNELYGLNITSVREVLEYTTITKVPKTAEFMRGVINVRGGVVPVVDLREKFGLDISEATVDTCIVVLEVNVDGETIVIGTIADTVEEVVEIPPDQIEPTPKIGTKLDTEFIEGIGKMNETFLIILDIDKIFTTEDISRVAESVEEG